METILKWHKAEEKIPNKGATIIFRRMNGSYAVGVVDLVKPYDAVAFATKTIETTYYMDYNTLWAYFNSPKEKEFHVYLNRATAISYCTYLSTLEAINDECDIIKTTQLSLLSTTLLEKYHVFLHKDDKQIEITLGDCQGTDRNIKVTDNLEKLVMAGEFSFE